MQRLLGRIALHVFGAGSLPASGAGVDRALPRHSARATMASWLERCFAAPGPEVLGQERTQDVLVIGFCAAFSLIGWLMILKGADQISRAREVASWPSVAGRIESVEVRVVAGPQGAHWRPHIVYTYEVAEQFLTGTRLSDGKVPLIKEVSEAQAYVAKYPPQTPVTVYYNPAQITEAVLEVRIPGRIYVTLAFGMAMAGIGPLLLIGLSWPGPYTGRPAGAISRKQVQR